VKPKHAEHRPKPHWLGNGSSACPHQVTICTISHGRQSTASGETCCAIGTRAPQRGHGRVGSGRPEGESQVGGVTGPEVYSIT
jgi:hypothetical protein